MELETSLLLSHMAYCVQVVTARSCLFATFVAIVFLCFVCISGTNMTVRSKCTVHCRCGSCI
jgi:hypothetical protein